MKKTRKSSSRKSASTSAPHRTQKSPPYRGRKRAATAPAASTALVDTGAAALAAPTIETVLVLRVCRADMTSSHGFRWPTSGPVEAPDWMPTNECGHGLHGWLWAVGDLPAIDYWDSEGAKWLVVEVAKADIIDLGAKVKFPRGNVIFCGDRVDAANYIKVRTPKDADTKGAPMFATATAGDYGTATAGDYGTAQAGDYGTAQAGDYGTAQAGDYGTATAGDYGTATAGNYGIAQAGDYGTATAQAGNYGIAQAGYQGTATAGHRGTATAGNYGTATAGDGGVIVIEYYDRKKNKYRKLCAAIDVDGPNKPDHWYHVVSDADGGNGRIEACGKVERDAEGKIVPFKVS